MESYKDTGNYRWCDFNITREAGHNYSDVKCVCGGYQSAVLNGDVYEIGTLSQLMWFAGQINDQTITSHKAKLTADITIDNSVVWTPISLKDSCESSFEGGYHTITFANTKEGSKFGLFGSYNYSTISNLYLKGSITCNQSDLLGALVNSGYRTTVTNVISTVSITNSGNASTGGLFGRLGGKNEQAMIKNCAVYADVSSAGRAGGLIGENWGGTQHCCVQNSAYKGDVTGGTAGAIMGYNGLQSGCKSYFTNVYYCEKDGLELCGATYGGTITTSGVESMTAEQFGSGEVTWLLNNSSSKGVWRQTLGTDSYPNFKGLTLYYGYPRCDSESVIYTNQAATASKPSHAMVDGYCTVCGYVTSASNEDGVYRITSAGDLVWFSNYVNGLVDGTKHQTENAILTKDIDMVNVTDYHPIGWTALYYKSVGDDLGYQGTFDGNGHTIKNLNIVGSNTDELTYGVFGTLSGSVKSLGVENFTFTVGSKDCRTGAIVGQIITGGAVTDCYAKNVTITTTNKVVGGIAGCNYSGTIEDCFSYNVSMTATRMGGIVGDNCDDNSSGRKGTVKNCYTNYESIESGDRAGNVSDSSASVTDKTFSSGEITYNLNNKSSDGIWRQTIGTDSSPNFTGGTVYYYTTSGYSNLLCSHENCDNGFCTFCSAYQPAELENGVYKIANAGNLFWFAELVNAENYDVDAVLTQDIDLENREWTPISRYIGVFDGNEHTISGLYYNNSSKDYIGLFGYLGKYVSGSYVGGTVKNVNIKNSSLTGDDHIGGIAGAALKNSVIENCTIDVTIVGSGSYIGGVTGENHAEIKSCVNNNSVTGGGCSVGGIAGANDGKIEKCTNNGDVTCNGSESAGGIVGENESIVEGCTNTGSVSGLSEVGGIVGGNDETGTIEMCANSGDVKALRMNISVVGGIVGRSHGKVLKCFNTGTVYGDGEKCGGIAGHCTDWRTPEGSVSDCVNIGSVSSKTDKYVGGIMGFLTAMLPVRTAIILPASETRPTMERPL